MALDHRASGPLSGIRVLDCSSSLSGAYCAKLFADAGADVVVLEPVGGHPMRRWSAGGDVPVGETGALFRYLHQWQRSVTEDAVDVDALLDVADVIVTNGDSLAGHASNLAEWYPSAVVVSVTPYGLTGPYADVPGTEFTAQADGGALSCRGTAEFPPFQMGGRVVEWVAGAYAAAAALIAVRGVRRDGHGDLIDVSLCELSNLTGTTFANLFHSLAGRPPIDPTVPVRSVEIPSIEPTSDGWVGFNTNTREQLDAVLMMIERDDLLVSGEFGMLQQRLARADEWNALMAGWTSERTTAEVVEAASALRIPVAPVCDGRSVTQTQIATERGIYLNDASSPMRAPRRPWSIDGEQQTEIGPCPDPGQHNSDRWSRAKAVAPVALGDAQLPLEGVRVVDLTAWWAGPSATHLLASLGAEVIHVESHRRIDGMRTAGGLFFGRDQWWEYSAFFLQVNTNKRDVTLDLDTARGKELLLELVATADVIVENYTPRVIEGFGLDWDTIRAANPRIVMMRMPAFGLTGTWRDRPGFAQTMEQITGLAWLTGHPEDQPRIQRGPCDPNGGMHAAFAVLCGLEQRDQTGVGCLIEAPMVEAALAVAAEPVLEWSTYGRLMERDGNRGPTAVPQGIYPTDGPEQWVAVACETEAQWSALVDLIGADELRNERFVTRAGRREAHDQIDTIIARWAARRSDHRAAQELAAVGVPAAVVRDVRRAHEHPQIVARRFFELVDHPVVGPHLTPTMPFRSRRVTRWFTTAAPTLGQDNDDVLGTMLGYDQTTLDELTKSGVIGTRPPGM